MHFQIVQVFCFDRGYCLDLELTYTVSVTTRTNKLIIPFVVLFYIHCVMRPCVMVLSNCTTCGSFHMITMYVIKWKQNSIVTILVQVRLNIDIPSKIHEISFCENYCLFFDWGYGFKTYDVIQLSDVMDTVAILQTSIVLYKTIKFCVMVFMAIL